MLCHGLKYGCHAHACVSMLSNKIRSVDTAFAWPRQAWPWHPIPKLNANQNLRDRASTSTLPTTGRTLGDLVAESSCFLELFRRDGVGQLLVQCPP
jgi:hypothetical protein